MTVQFSAKPGCWERHLQRKYNNPLFNNPAITQAEIYAARQQDQTERENFQQAFETLLQEVAHLKPQVEAEVVLNISAKIDSLYEQCAGLGGDCSQEKLSLQKLAEVTQQSILASGVNDAAFIANIEKEATARQMHFNLLAYPLIAHLMHPQSPIKQDEIVPTLLTETEASLRAAMRLFTLEQQKILCNAARELLEQLQQKGYPMPEAWQRLTLMEQPLSNAN